MWEILKAPTRQSNVYLLKNKPHYVLIDSGMRGDRDYLFDFLKSQGLKENDPLHIMVTHGHKDHISNINALSLHFNTTVYSSELVKEKLLLGKSEDIEASNLFMMVVTGITATVPSLRTFDPVETDILVNDGDHLVFGDEDLTILSTPGHTEGSISILTGNDEMFVGDACFNIYSKDVFPPIMTDLEALSKTYDLYIEKDPRILYPGHGESFSIHKVKASLRHFK